MEKFSSKLTGAKKLGSVDYYTGSGVKRMLIVNKCKGMSVRRLKEG